MYQYEIYAAALALDDNRKQLVIILYMLYVEEYAWHNVDVRTYSLLLTDNSLSIKFNRDIVTKSLVNDRLNYKLN